MEKIEFPHEPDEPGVMSHSYRCRGCIKRDFGSIAGYLAMAKEHQHSGRCVEYGCLYGDKEYGKYVRDVFMGIAHKKRESPMKTMVGYQLWKIEEEGGATHAVIAESDAQAAGIWLEHFVIRNGDDTCPGKLPSIEPYGRDQEYTFAPWGDERKLKATAAEWCSLISGPMYLGCSEF